VPLVPAIVQPVTVEILVFPVMVPIVKMAEVWVHFQPVLVLVLPLGRELIVQLVI